jgi:hypothetical protein
MAARLGYALERLCAADVSEKVYPLSGNASNHSHKKAPDTLGDVRRCYLTQSGPRKGEGKGQNLPVATTAAATAALTALGTILAGAGFVDFEGTAV